jgi:hypothetical protein
MGVPGILFRAAIASLALAIATPAQAQTGLHTIDLSTSQANAANWTTYEISGGHLVSSQAVYAGTYAGLPHITFPFGSNDGFWYATFMFSLPVNASSPILSVRPEGI